MYTRTSNTDRIDVDSILQSVKLVKRNSAKDGLNGVFYISKKHLDTSAAMLKIRTGRKESIEEKEPLITKSRKRKLDKSKPTSKPTPTKNKKDNKLKKSKMKPAKGPKPSKPKKIKIDKTNPNWKLKPNLSIEVWEKVGRVSILLYTVFLSRRGLQCLGTFSPLVSPLAVPYWNL